LESIPFLKQWPLLVDNITEHFKKFAIDFKEHKHPMMFFVDGSQENSVFVQKPFRSNVLVLGGTNQLL
jgi:hypothetical protein